MPTFTARGLEGEDSADAAPVVEEDPVAKYLVDSEGDEDDEATGASASAGGPSSLRAAPEEEVLEILSGDAEEFSVAPSCPITEGGGEEEEDQKIRAERHEGRSKKRHDKPVGGLAGAPLKIKAEAAPGGDSGGGITSRLRRSM